MVSGVSKNLVSENVDGVWPKNSLRAMARQVPDPCCVCCCISAKSDHFPTFGVHISGVNFKKPVQVG